jgi:hypothetical protein
MQNPDLKKRLKSRRSVREKEGDTCEGGGG